VVKEKRWKLLFTKAAMKDAKKILSANLKNQTDKILDILEQDPYQNSPPFEKLVGDLSGYYSRRINIQHRIVYQVESEEHSVRILRMFSHYGDN
jgi:toxin YoeB